MKNIKKYIVATLLCCIVMQPIQVYAEEIQKDVVTQKTVADIMEIQETVTQEKQQAFIQQEIEMKKVVPEVQTADTLIEHETADGFTYTLNENNEATITGCTVEHSELVIPGTVDGYIVKTVGFEAFEKDKLITKVTISENIENIDCFAFSQCINMEDVTLPSTIKIINNDAFMLGKYTNIEIPDGCERIAVGAFETNGLYEMKIPKSVIRLGYNESKLEDTGQYKISQGSSGERIVGYAGSASEEYAKAFGYIFINIEWIPLQQFVLPESIQLNLNERVKFPISFFPKDAYSEFTKIDGYDTVKVTDEGVTASITNYEVVDGELYLTPTSEGVAKFSVYKNSVKNYMPDFLRSNVCTITVVDPSKINANSITLKDANNNTINNATLSYDTYNKGCIYPITLETNHLDANEDITFTSTNETLANVSKENGNYVLTLSNAYILKPRTCTITATGKRSGVAATFDVQIVYGGAASITFDSSFENNKQGKVNRIVQDSEYDMPIKVVPESLVNDSIITIQNPQTEGETVITYDKITSRLKAVGVGTATIKAECKGQIISYDFEVLPYEKEATSVTIDTNDRVTKTDAGYALAMDLTDTYQLSATVVPVDTTDIRQWIDTSKNGVISIDNQGNVTALKAGTAKVTVYEGSYLDTVIYNVKSDELTVTVTDPNAVVEEPKPVVIHATNYVLNNKSTTMNIGEILQLNPVITPTNTTDKIVYKTSDSSVATISDTGLVRVVGAGTTWVSGTVNSMWQGIKITVEKVIIQPSITLSTTSLTIKRGETKQISATLGANTLAPQWESNNESIIIIATDGAITAVGMGTTYVQAFSLSIDGSQYTTALCEVTVTDDNTSTDTGTTSGSTDNKTVSEVKAPGNITLNASKFNIQKGKTTKALAISSSTYDNDNIVSVTSSKSKILKASVSGGKIVLKGVKASNKYVTVTIKTESGAMATCSVKVVKSKVSTSKLKLSMKKVTLKKGESTKLAIIQTPISATDKLTWTSSNKKVATVSKKGKIIAKKKGSATITLRSSNGKKVTCKVIVK